MIFVFRVGVGLFEAVAALDEGLDFSGRKNEPILGGIVREATLLVHFENFGGVVHLAFFLFPPLGLDLTELLESAVEEAGQALLVKADVGEGLGSEMENLREGYGRGGSRFIGTDGADMILGDEGEVGGLGGRDTIEAPDGVAQRLDQLFFERAFGLELVDETLVVALVSGKIFCWQDDDVSGEAVAQGVQG